MRLAFITQDFLPETGGIQTYSFELAKNLSQLCEKFILIAPAKKESQKIDKDISYEVIRIPCANARLSLALLPRLKSILRRRKIDHTFHAQWQTILPAARLKKQGIVKHIFLAAHGRELLFNPFSGILLLDRLYTSYQYRMLQKATRYFPVSKFTAKLLEQQGLSKAKINVIHNGTDFNRFLPIDSTTLRQQLQLAGKTILFTVCRHVERKGIQDVLLALPAVLRSYPDLHYIVGGSGPYTKALKKQVQNLRLEKHITFVGRIPDDQLRAYYSLCDIFIMTPRQVYPDIEGFGIVYLEANASAKPVIGTFSGGVPDAIQHGKTGLLVERQSINAISEAIMKLTRNHRLRIQLGQKGQAWVKAEMNWKVASQQLFKQLCDGTKLC